MKPQELIRPDKLLMQGLKTLSDLGQKSLYTNQKTEAKARAELTFIGDKKMDEVQIQLYEYDQHSFKKEELIKDFAFIKEPRQDQNYWLNFHGIHDVEIIQEVGSVIKLDRLTIRQILDTTQRPKVEEYDDHLFFSIKSIVKKEEGLLHIEQLSFILGAYYIVSFQEEVGDHFDGIRNKLSEDLGLIRKRKSDFLLSQLLDAILDNYFETIEQVNIDIEVLEKEVLQNPTNATLISLETNKSIAQAIKKALSPFKDALTSIAEEHSHLIKESNLKYFKDLVNSSVAAMEDVEALLRALEGLTNIYFASLSNKMNETMKVLTTVATIFIPLTFIAGIYGMNFSNMPELQTKNGYFITLGVMGLILIGMLVYFRRKKWI